MTDLESARRLADKLDEVPTYSCGEGAIALRSMADEIERLREVAIESNAVCACGCPVSDHESGDDAAESCSIEGHDCVPTSKSVLTMLVALREENERLDILFQNTHGVHHSWVDGYERAKSQYEELKDALTSKSWSPRDNHEQLVAVAKRMREKELKVRAI